MHNTIHSRLKELFDIDQTAQKKLGELLRNRKMRIPDKLAQDLSQFRSYMIFSEYLFAARTGNSKLEIRARAAEVHCELGQKIIEQLLKQL